MVSNFSKKIALQAHSLELKEVFSLLKSSKKGIEEREAKRRLKIFGRNKLPEKEPLNFFNFLFAQINNLLVYIVFFSALISLFLKRFVDAVFILFVIVLNIVIGAFQEYKAEKTFLELKRSMRKKARVVREGKEMIVLSEEIVPGDIIVLRKGDEVLADARIIESFNLFCDQSSLTGEFFPQEKREGVLPEKTEMPERTNMVFAGSLVVSGAGKGVVVACGLDSYLGKVYQLLREGEEKSLLQKKIERFVGFIVKIIAFSIVLIFFFGYLRGHKIGDLFLSSISLTVSAIPEGLLPLVTIILIFGTRRIYKKRSLLKRLSSLESLGSLTTIVTDKTGTLTEGKMTLLKIITLDGEGRNLPDKSYLLALKIAILASDAFIENLDRPEKRIVVRGSPTEKAVIFAGLENGLIKDEILKESPQIDFLPFDSGLRFSASLNLDKKKNILFLSLLGSPETILRKSDKVYQKGRVVRLKERERNFFQKKLEKMTGGGFRLLACAFKEIPKKNYKNISLNDLSSGLTFLGFLVLEDPLRKEASQTLETLKKAGIRTIIATGDSRLTAFRIANNLNIKTKKREIIVGSQIREMKDKEIREIVKERNVFAEVIPEDKLKIVRALKENGEVVAMVGDGVNDAPAIKIANVGVALNSGSQITKEAADLILVDNNLTSLKNSVFEGRNIIENLRKAIIYLVSDSFSEVILFIFSMLFFLPLPLLPTQILWINIIEDGLPPVAFALERENFGDLIKRRKGEILTKKIRGWMIWIGIITGFFACFSFLFFLEFFSLEKTRTLLFVFMALDSLVYAFCIRNLRDSVFKKESFRNNYLNLFILFGLIMIVLAVYFPLGAKITHSVRLNYFDWAIVSLICFSELILIEITKKRIFGNKTKMVNNQ